jgi:polyhydroxybutyrate depolymerase
MFKKIMFFLALCCFIIPLYAQDTDFLTGTLTFEGRDRQYWVALPENYAADTPAPMVILLHGAGGTAQEFLAFTGYRRLAEETGTILVAPQGVQNSWGYLDPEQLHPEDLYTNDWDFLAVLIDQLVTEYAVDTERVYLIGLSNGGMLAQRTMCEHGDKLAGVAIIIAAMNNLLAEHCMSMSPLPLLMIRATNDEIFPWAGAATFKSDGRFLLNYSSQQMMDFYTGLLGCSRPDGVTNRTAPGSANRAVLDSYTRCRADSAALMYALFDFPHAYPQNIFVILKEDKVGTLEDAIWEFFAAHPAPTPEPEADATAEATEMP